MRLNGDMRSRLSLLVSIHASVKDATNSQNIILAKPTVSIHASVKDATYDADGENLQICFNPRICKRCDPNLLQGVSIDIVSIHASVKDATSTKDGSLKL